jgi:hypothetical protein
LAWAYKLAKTPAAVRITSRITSRHQCLLLMGVSLLGGSICHGEYSHSQRLWYSAAQLESWAGSQLHLSK